MSTPNGSAVLFVERQWLPGWALALLLAGPALSLPNMLVINSVMGPRKTTVYVILVIIMATLSGWGFGALFA